MYDFKFDYTNFFDLNDKRDHTYRSVQNDFVSNFANFAHRYMNVDHASALVIGETLWTRMSDKRLHYHTPVHVMSIFQDFYKFAKERKFPEFLEAWNSPEHHLAIWFHDAVYVVGAKPGVNEKSSGQFMRSMMQPFCDEDSLDKADLLVNATAEFNNLKLEGKFHAIMDLDISNFTWEWKNHEAASECVAREFSNICTPKQYNEGRGSFLKMILDRDRIFRTESLNEYGDRLAKENIANALSKLGQCC